MPRTARAPLAAFLTLCLLGSLGPLRSELGPAVTPSAAPPWLLPAWPFALAAIAAAVFALLRHHLWLSVRDLRRASLIGMGIFALPAFTLHCVQVWIDPFAQVTLLALAPVFTVVLQPHIAPNSALPRHALAAGLAAAAGLMLVFPFQLPGTFAAFAAWLAGAFAVVVVAASYCCANHIASQLSRSCMAPLAATASGASAAAFLLAGIVEQALGLHVAASGAGLVWPVLVDVPSILLLFWLLPRISAARIASHFILSPLISSLAGILLIRPTLSVRDAAGLTLAAAGSAWLLAGPASRPDTESSLL